MCGRPLEPCEFEAAGNVRRFQERFYRSLWGIAFYYPIEIWWKRIVFPRTSDLSQLRVRVLWVDRVLVFTFAAMTLLVPYIGPMAFLWRNTSYAERFILAIVVPQLTFHAIMSTVIFLHHTHPRVMWFRTKSEWNFYQGQVRNTVQVQFPLLIDLVLLNIMSHTAHHVDSKTPLYRLRAAQAELVAELGEDVIVQKFSLRCLRRILKSCQLYDYSGRRWLDFSGNPTSPEVPLTVHDTAAR